MVYAGITFTLPMKAADTEVSEATLMATFTPGQDVNALLFQTERTTYRCTFPFAIRYEPGRILRRGPVKTTSTVMQAASVDLYRTTADQMYTNNYVRPQENGHRTDTRWVEPDPQRRKKGLLIRADSTIGFNALRNSVEDFDSEEAISRPRQWTNFTPKKLLTIMRKKLKCYYAA